MAKPNGPKSSELSRERAAQLVSEAECLAAGETPADVCKRFGVSTKTLQRWRHRVAADPELTAIVQSKKSEASKGWEQERLRFLRDAIRKMGTLVQEATVADLRQVAGAIKIVGDLHSLSRALGFENDGKQSGGAGATEAPPAPGGGSPESETDPEARIH